jgi:hypothetical protein
VSRRDWLIACAFVFAWALPARAEAVFHLTIQSQPGDYIGGGRAYDLYFHGPPDLLAPNPGFSSGNLVALSLVASSTTEYASFTFETVHLGTPLQPGTYVGAQMGFLSEPGHPGMYIALEGRGASQVAGSFVIDRITLAPDNSLLSFAATFQQLSKVPRSASQVASLTT